jgi:hypothetical protein
MNASTLWQGYCQTSPSMSLVVVHDPFTPNVSLVVYLVDASQPIFVFEFSVAHPHWAFSQCHVLAHD